MYRVIYQLSCPHVSSTDTNPGKIQASQAKEDKAKVALGLVVAAVAVVAGILVASTGSKKKEEPAPVPAKKKWF